MLSYGSQKWLEEEAWQAGGAKRFPCPKCKAPRRQACVGPSGKAVLTHKERDAVWREYCYRAPYVLAWLEDMGIPWFEGVIKDYLIAGKRPKRRRTDIQIAERRLDDAVRLLRPATEVMRAPGGLRHRTDGETCFCDDCAFARQADYR